VVEPPASLARISARVRYVRKTGIQRKIRDILMRDASLYAVTREDLARRYLQGDGIEIGPLTWPMRMPPGARVRYVDHAGRDELIRLYGDSFDGQGAYASAIPETDVVDDGATLATFADASVDFVVANHVLEHIEDPIGALENLLRVIRPGGVLFLALPDARHTFDARRDRTSVDHLLRDHRDGPEGSRHAHYEEWARIIESRPEDQVAQRVAEFAAEEARNHFHVWELDTFLELIRALDLPCSLELGQTNHHEFIVILRRTAAEA
jgi:predicted SAM-dependent methyltransferase